jgi:hypothetical protein
MESVPRHGSKCKINCFAGYCYDRSDVHHKAEESRTTKNRDKRFKEEKELANDHELQYNEASMQQKYPDSSRSFTEEDEFLAATRQQSKKGR